MLSHALRVIGRRSRCRVIKTRQSQIESAKM